MSFALITEAAAEQEWGDAVNWCEKRESGVGLRFNEAIQSVLRTVAQDPERFPLINLRTRKAKIVGWPYSIYFAINARHQEIKIVAVWHGAQNPARLRGRLK